MEITSPLLDNLVGRVLTFGTATIAIKVLEVEAIKVLEVDLKITNQTTLVGILAATLFGTTLAATFCFARDLLAGELKSEQAALAIEQAQAAASHARAGASKGAVERFGELHLILRSIVTVLVYLVPILYGYAVFLFCIDEVAAAGLTLLKE